MARTVDARPSAVDLKIYQGDDLYLKINVVDSAGKPENLTGAVATAQVRATTDDAVVLADFATVIDGDAVYLHLAAEDTAGMTGPAVWDVQVMYLDGTIATLAAGHVTVVEEVTR